MAVYAWMVPVRAPHIAVRPRHDGDRAVMVSVVSEPEFARSASDGELCVTDCPEQQHGGQQAPS